MGVKSGAAGGYNIIGRDVAQERGQAGKAASRLASAKSGGAGIGGLLGAIAGVALAPFTGGASLLLLGAVGGGLGALAGSKIGGATSGVDQGDIMGGKFFQKSRVGMAEDIAKQEFMNVGKAAISGAMNAGAIGAGLDAFKLGATGAKAAGGSGLMGGIKGLGEHFMPSLGTEATTKGMVETSLSGSEGFNILDMVGSVNKGAGAASGVTGGVAQGGLGRAIGGVYGGADKLLGGILPDGQALGEGYLGKGVGALKGLLGSQTGQEEYGGAPMATAGFELPDSSGGGENPFGSPEELLNFQKMYNEQMGGPTMPISEDGSWGPESQGAYEMWQMNQ